MSIIGEIEAGWNRPPIFVRRQPRAEPSPQVPTEATGEWLDRLSAFHESAHIITAAAVGLRISGARIAAAGNGGGHVSFSATAATPTNVERKLVCLAAGKIAQHLVGAVGARFDGYCASDTSQIESVVQRVWAKDRERVLALIDEQTRSILVQNWHVVEDVAAMLMRHRELSESDITRLTASVRAVEVPDFNRALRAPRPLYRRRDGLLAIRTRHGFTRAFDPSTREIDAVISTGMAVGRRDWDGEYDEVLANAAGERAPW